MAKLPALTGTPKQIAWAESIRRSQVAAMAEHVRVTEDDPRLQSGYGKALRLALERQRRLFRAVCGHAEASWWIERRDWSVGQLACEQDQSERMLRSVGQARERPDPLH